MKRRILFSFLMMLFISGCTTDTPPDQEVTISVASRKSPCFVSKQKLCMSIKVSGNDEFYNHYGIIEGFTHQWGTSCSLTAKVIHLKAPPVDTQASDYRFQLIKLTSAVEDETGRRYDYTDVDIVENAITRDESGYFFLGKPFACAPGVDCDALLGSQKPLTTADLIFEYIGNEQIRLIGSYIEVITEFIETKDFPFNTVIEYVVITPPTLIEITHSDSFITEREETYLIEDQAALDALNQSLEESDKITDFILEDYSYFLIRAKECLDVFYNVSQYFNDNVLTITLDHYRRTNADCPDSAYDGYAVFRSKKPEAIAP